MRTVICSVAVLIVAIGIVVDVAAAPENNSSLAALIADQSSLTPLIALIALIRTPLIP